MSNPGSSTEPATTRVARKLSLTEAELFVLVTLVTVEMLALSLYFSLSTARVTEVRYVLYPFVWINVAVLAVWKTRTAPTSDRKRWLAGGIAVAYFAVLAYAGGVIGPGGNAFGLSLHIFDAPPGYAPTVLFDNGLVHLAVMPYKLVGYLALAYLVYATVIEAVGSAVSGLLGLLSCVSCTWPVLASVVAGLAGGSAAVTSAVMTYSLDLSTVVFVSAVALLYWRPGFGD